MSPGAARLGSFEAHKPLGKGGMGEVWLGRHVASGLPVAIKAVTAEHGRTPWHQAAFADEVNAVARMHHPSIVHIFDHGVIDEQAERALEGRLLAGSPYLVMELATGGTLRTAMPRTWPELRDSLSTVLAALGHAHSRGLIHRDLKPGNVLVSGPGDLRRGLKLADFGAAYRLDVDRGGEGKPSLLGTPHYMAPEQVLSDEHQIGPATDLYALGCLAWKLSTGRTLFRAKTVEALLEAQVLRPPSRLVPMVPVPPGFEVWLRRLLEKQPSDRFVCAADAVWALEALGEASGSVSAAPRSAADAAAKTQVLDPPVTCSAPRGATRAPARRAPVPQSWRRKEPIPAPPLLGAGLGLFGLRRLPLVGREPEQELLWAELRRVDRDRRARLVLLEGAQGVGKTGLARWLVERAVELGAATALEAVHDPHGGAGSGFAPMLRRALRTRAAVESVAEAVEARLMSQGIDDPGEWRGLVELALPGSEQALGGVEGTRMSNDEERFAALARFVAREARERPVILWVDDIQWSAEALSFLLWYARRQETNPAPVLILATLRPDAGVPDGPLGAQIDALRGLPMSTVRSVPPLSPAPIRGLITDLLHLTGDLADQVASRAAGNPLFAVQLVGDWVAQQVLLPTPRGFELAEGVEFSLPDSIHELFQGPIRAALSALPADALVQLELAAALGSPASARELRAACVQAGLSFEPGLMEGLVRRGLLVRERTSWAFVHGLLVESIDRTRDEGGRRARVHEACARALEVVHGAGARQVLGRVGLHRIEAGQPEAALAPLLEAAAHQFDSGATGEVLRLLDLRDRAVASLDLAEEDSRRIEGVLARARTLRARPDRTTALPMLAALEEPLRRNGSRELLARFLLIKARIEAAGLDVAASSATAERLALVSDGLSTPQDRLLEQMLRGFLAARSGQRDRALEIHLAVRALAEELDQPYFVAQFDLTIGFHHLLQGELDEAGALVANVLDSSRALGFRWITAQATNLHASVLRARKQWVEARAAYERAHAEYDLIVSDGAPLVLNNLAGMLCEQALWSEARPIARRVRVSFRASRRQPWEAMAVTVQALCDVGEGRWDAGSARLAEAAELLEPCSSAQSGSAQMAEKAAEIALESGQLALAIEALELAAMHWRRLGRAAALEAVQGQIDELASRPAPTS